MASTAQQIAEQTADVWIRGDAIMQSRRIPAPVRFPLVAATSIILSAVLYSVTADYTIAHFAGASRRLDTWGQVGTLLAFRIFELGFGWYQNYDGYDLASLTILSHGPPLYLLGTFYEIRPSAIILSLLIDSATAYIPFRFLRPLSRAHSSSSSPDSITVSNNDIVTSTTIQAYTTVLAASIYSVTLYTAYSTYLPVYLVTYFADIKSVASAHSATPISLFPVTLLFGMAARSLIFTPAATVTSSQADDKLAAFKPESATFEETLQYNFWGYNTRTKFVIKRTASLMLIIGTNTFVQTILTVEGVEAIGLIAYLWPWVAATAFTGAALGLVGAE